MCACGYVHTRRSVWHALIPPSHSLPSPRARPLACRGMCGVGMWVWTYVYNYLCIFVSVPLCTHVRTHARTHARTHTHIHTQTVIKATSVTFPEGKDVPKVSDKAREFIRKALAHDSNSRPDVMTIFMDPYLRQTGRQASAPYHTSS